jgi:hypothetical protein
MLVTLWILLAAVATLVIFFGGPHNIRWALGGIATLGFFSTLLVVNRVP